MTLRKSVYTLVILYGCLSLTGCANSKEDIFPDNMRPMGQVYDEHFARLRQTQTPRQPQSLHEDPGFAELDKSSNAVRPTVTPSAGSGAMGTTTTNLDGGTAFKSPAEHARVHQQDLDAQTRYARDAKHEIDTLFPTLPNPHLVMYVFPHLSEDGVPVPGYATSFPMYEKTEYALPGEVR